jgi:hypothetical protein
MFNPSNITTIATSCISARIGKGTLNDARIEWRWVKVKAAEGLSM